jgi:acyl dehydratase
VLRIVSFEHSASKARERRLEALSHMLRGASGRKLAKGKPMTKQDAQPLYLEDFHVGQTFTSATRAVDEAEIKEFAGKYDPQPFHLDNEAAKGTIFQGLAASGWHTMAMTMRLMVDGGVPVAGGIIGAGGEINWPRPTRPGDVLQVVSEVMEVTPSKSRPDRGMVTMRSETRNQRGEVVQVLVAKLVVPKAPAKGKA